MEKSFDDNLLSVTEKYMTIGKNGFEWKYTPADFVRNARKYGLSAALQDDWKVTQARMGLVLDLILVNLQIKGEKILYRNVRDSYRQSKDLW